MKTSSLLLVTTLTACAAKEFSPPTHKRHTGDTSDTGDSALPEQHAPRLFNEDSTFQWFGEPHFSDGIQTTVDYEDQDEDLLGGPLHLHVEKDGAAWDEVDMALASEDVPVEDHSLLFAFLIPEPNAAYRLTFYVTDQAGHRSNEVQTEP